MPQTDLVIFVDTLGKYSREEYLRRFSTPLYAPKVWNSLSRLKSRDSREGRVASMNCFKKTFKELNELNQSEDEQEKEAAKTIDKIIDEFLLFVKDKNDFLFKKLKRLKYGRLGR